MKYKVLTDLTIDGKEIKKGSTAEISDAVARLYLTKGYISEVEVKTNDNDKK